VPVLRVLRSTSIRRGDISTFLVRPLKLTSGFLCQQEEAAMTSGGPVVQGPDSRLPLGGPTSLQCLQ